MALQGRMLMGRRFNSHDLYRDWRLDIDNMSYEQLLELGERIGYVNTGLEEDEIEPYIRKTKLQFCEDASEHQVDKKCSICQVENMSGLLKAANITIKSYSSSLFCKLAQIKSIDDLALI